MNSPFVNFCLNYETNLIEKNIINKNSIIDFKKSIINLPRLSKGPLNVIILSDGSTFYLPCSIFSTYKKLNNSSGTTIKFLLNKSDLFSSLAAK
jgi:hypothetical protein